MDLHNNRFLSQKNQLEMICSLPEHRTFEGFFNIFDTFVSKLNSLKSMTGRFRKDHNFENKKKYKVQTVNIDPKTFFILLLKAFLNFSYSIFQCRFTITIRTLQAFSFDHSFLILLLKSFH